MKATIMIKGKMALVTKLTVLPPFALKVFLVVKQLAEEVGITGFWLCSTMRLSCKTLMGPLTNVCR